MTSSRASLIVVEGEQRGCEFSLGASVTTIGRDESNIIKLATRQASRKHALIEYRDGKYWLRDLRSGNGTILNTSRITQPTSLQDGDIIKIADVIFIFRLEPQDAPPLSAELTLVDANNTHTTAELHFDGQRSFLSSPAAQMPVAELAKANAKLRALYHVNNAINSIHELAGLLKAILEAVFEVMPAERGAILLYDEGRRNLVPVVTHVRDAAADQDIVISQTIIKRVTSERISILSRDTLCDERFAQAMSIVNQGIRSSMSVPLISKTTLLGVLYIDSTQENVHFNEDNLELLTAIAGQAAVAIENVRLLEEVQKARQEESKLLEITSAISSELQLDILLSKIVQAATEMLDADRGTLFMYDPQRHELWSQIAQGLEVKQIRFPATAGIAGECFTSGKVLNIPDAYQDKRFNPEVDRKTGYTTRNILCMPIENKEGKKLGVLQILNKREGPFQASDERRLRAFAAQMSITLENAQLFEEVLNARNYNESILQSLRNGVITLDADKRIMKINQAASNILQIDPRQNTSKFIADLFYGPNQWITNSIEKVSQTGKVDLTMDTDITLTTGQVISVNATVVPLIDIKKKPLGFMLVVEDISREKRIKARMSRYMRKDVLDKLLEGGDAVLGGTLQEVTVLFSDIRSFTTISEKLGARETVSMLNEYFTEMIDAIFESGGILDKYIGDAIMALFGIPFKSEQDADNAVSAANQMMIALRRLNQRRKAKGAEPLDIGIGLSTGEVVSGNIGCPKRMDYTVIGDTVNIASRLEGANKYYGTKILLSEFTLKNMRRPTPIREIDLIRVKGKTKPVAVYEALEHYDEENFPNMEQTLQAFAQGLAHYRERSWSAAIACFEQALQYNPHDKLSQVYRQRCQAYRQTPPPASWDGVYVMQEK